MVLQIDPRRLEVPVELVHTPRGTMPHILGPVPGRAVVRIRTLGELDEAPDLL
jgi:hypothetical protein